MLSILSFIFGTVGTTYAFLFALLRLTQDPKEPPAIATTIPFISPIVGVLSSGMQKFAVRLRDKYGLPIYTLRMPGQRIYMINSLPLIAAMQRQHKTIAFAPIEAQAAATVMGVGPAGNAIIGASNMLDDDSYLSTFVPSVHPGLSPGPGLDSLNEAAVRYLSTALSELNDNSPTVVDLFSWIRDQLCMATTEAMYGPKNPFRDPAVQQAWYAFEPYIVVHMLKAWPSVLARKSLHAREQVIIPAFERYFADDGLVTASTLAQCRYNHNTSHGLRGRDVAATEIGQLVASLTNSMASAFWMVYHVFSNPAVLDDCREEIEKLVQIDEDGVYVIDLAKVKSSCPILLSTWQETLRYTHIGVAARVVMEEITLDNKYLLKKGATVMAVTPVQHTDESTWGPTVRQFNHRRFLHVPGKKPTPRSAFRSFGGGTVLCPGRHFVSTEVMALTALLLLRFDLKPVTRDRKWIEPAKNLPMTSSIPTPKGEVSVEMTSRDSRKWRVEFSASKRGVEMVVEDEVRQ